MTEAFVAPHPPYLLTVFLEDTDATGFVYHSNYLNLPPDAFFERPKNRDMF